MTPNSPLTYEDFISQVEVAMPLDSPFRVTPTEGVITEFDKANTNFKFKDIEVGKIYAFWPNSEANKLGMKEIWFLTPSVIQDIDNYFVYWCYYSRPGEGITKQSSGADYILDTPRGERCEGWVGYVWNDRRWKVLENNIPHFNPFINWLNENPFEVKQ